MGLSARIQGEHGLETLGEKVLAFLASYLDAQVGAVFVTATENRLLRIAGYAIPDGMQAAAVQHGEGLLGQAVKDNRMLHVRDLPDNYIAIGSSLGRSRPRELLVAPASVSGTVYAVVELGFFRRILPADRELLARISDSLGIAVRASSDRTRLEELLAQTQRQGEELQMQQEELRVTNEELEIQTAALKVSNAELEAQQAELEQTNVQLEEQAQVLEHQKEELGQAQIGLIDRATELERASQYKSEFLANMSHELRTPLNSALILAKILADNKSGNLTAEQVRFANTISTAGNDLLAIINDILDLSKVEAGKVELEIKPVLVSRVVETVVKALQPMAQQKRLHFSAVIEPGTPAKVETDELRLGQILKNLLSNAVKFTEQGEVATRVFSADVNSISFAVRDTGIGISAQQQGFIFEAFRQADGSTHRKFGGTGLGLTISRDLARLLGGNISVKSAAGNGSLFTLTLPLTHSAAQAAATLAAAAIPDSFFRPSSGPTSSGARA